MFKLASKKQIKKIQNKFSSNCFYAPNLQTPAPAINEEETSPSHRQARSPTPPLAKRKLFDTSTMTDEVVLVTQTIQIFPKHRLLLFQDI